MGMDAIRQESPRADARHPLARMPDLPRSPVHAHGQPELLLWRTAPEKDVLAALDVLRALAAMDPDNDLAIVLPTGVAHVTIGPGRFVAASVRDRSLEIVVHESDAAAARVHIPWARAAACLPLDPAAAFAVVAEHAAAAIPLLEHSLSAGPLPDPGTEDDLRAIGAAVLAAASSDGGYARLVLPSPWGPAAIAPLAVPVPAPVVELDDRSVELAAHLLPRVHAVSRDVGSPLSPPPVVLGAVSIPVEPIDPTEAMRRLGAILPHGGRPLSARARADLLRRIGAAS